MEEFGRLLADQRKHFEQHPDLARGAISGGDIRLPESNAADTAAWVTVAHALLNLDETITRP
jgi:hypothetical protein